MKQPQVLLEMIDRNEFKLEESRVWPTFPAEGTKVALNIVGLLLVPGKLLIAVGKPLQEMAEVPCAVLAKNAWPYGTKDTIDLCETTLQRRGATFRDIVGHGDKCKQATVRCRFAESAFTVYYVGFAAEIVMQFETAIIY